MIIRTILLAFLVLGMAACGSKEKTQDFGELKVDGADKAAAPTADAPLEDLEKELEAPEEPPKSTTQEKEAPVSEAQFSEELKVIRSSNNTSEVTRAAAKILEVQPKNLQALNGLAMHYFKIGRTGMARRILDRALDSYPKEASLYNNLGLIHMREDRLREAILAFKKAVEFDGQNASAARNLGSVYANYRDYQRAFPLLLMAYKKYPQDELVAANMAVTLKGLGKTKAASEVYEKRLAATQDSSVLYNYAALLVNDLGDYKKGLEVIEKAKGGKLESAMAKKLSLLEGRAKARLK